MRDPYLNKIAIWTYYKGAKIDPGIDAGATTVAYLPEKGWFWYIPLPDDIVSVGVVAEKDYLYKESRDLETIYQGEIKKNLWIEQHVSVGQQTGPYRVTGEYSYRSKHCASSRIPRVRAKRMERSCKAFGSTSEISRTAVRYLSRRVRSRLA